LATLWFADTERKTIIFDEVADGVIATLSPVISVNEVLVVLKVSVLVVDTTCNIFPGTIAATFAVVANVPVAAGKVKVLVPEAAVGTISTYPLDAP
jgi:hypothetical protein